MDLESWSHVITWVSIGTDHRKKKKGKGKGRKETADFAVGPAWQHKSSIPLLMRRRPLAQHTLTSFYMQKNRRTWGKRRKEGRKDRLHKQQSPVVWRTSVDAADCCLCFRMPWSTRTYHYIFTSHFIWWQCINRKNQDGDTKTSRKHVA